MSSQDSSCRHASCLNPVRRFSVEDDSGSRLQFSALISLNNMVVPLKHVYLAVSLDIVSFFSFSSSVFLHSLYSSLCRFHHVAFPLRFCALFTRCPSVSIPFVKCVSALNLNLQSLILILMSLSANFGNSTTVAPSGAVVTGCPNDCNRHVSGLNYVSWSQMSITATYTAETLLYIVNNRTNSTRTSTIKNTEINFANISTPTSTNSAGTVTASFSLTDGNIVTA